MHTVCPTTFDAKEALKVSAKRGASPRVKSVKMEATRDLAK
jgi:hypothetical protein